MFQFETEDLGVHDAESPEEATQKLDLFVKDRMLHYKETVMQARVGRPAPPISGPVPLPLAPVGPVINTPPPFVPQAPAAYGPPSPPNTAGAPSSPPPEFD